MMSKYLFIKNLELKNKKHFQWENGIWTGNEGPFRKIKILRNTNFEINGFFDFGNVAEIEIEEKYFPGKSLRNNDILIERSGGGPNTPVGRVAFYKGEDSIYSFSNFTSRVRVIGDEVDADYLHKFLMHLHLNKHTEKIQTQTTNIRNLEFEKYLSFKLPLPDNKKNQQAIALEIKEKLFAVEQMRQAAIRQKEAVEAMQGALLREVFPYKEGDKLPEGWKWEEIDQIREKNVEILTKDFNTEFTYIDISSIDNFYRRILNPRKIFAKDAPSRAKFMLKKGDIIISNVRPNLNAVAMIPENLDGSIGSSGFTVIRPKEAFLNGFMVLFFTSPYFINYVTELVQGAMYPAISDKDIFKCLVPIPSFKEQKRVYQKIKSELNEIYQLKKFVDSQLEAIEALPASILREVFEFKS